MRVDHGELKTQGIQKSPFCHDDRFLEVREVSCILELGLHRFLVFVPRLECNIGHILQLSGFSVMMQAER